jgi:hypothetical protein
MKGFRITNLGESKTSTDAAPRSELESRALFENDLSQHIANSTVIAKDGVRSATQARHGDDLVPLRQVKKLIGAGAGAPDAVLTTEVDQVVGGYKIFRQLCLNPRTLTTLVNGANNDVTFGLSTNGCFMRISGPTAVFDVTGFQRDGTHLGGSPGQMIVLYNATTSIMTLYSDTSAFAVNSLAQNRLRFATDSLTLRPRGSIILLYSNTDSRWIPASFA